MSIREYVTPRSLALLFVFSPGMFLGLFLTPTSEWDMTTLAHVVAAVCVMAFLYVIIFALFDFLRGCSAERAFGIKPLWYNRFDHF
jgi:hypothetical protein